MDIKCKGFKSKTIDGELTKFLIHKDKDNIIYIIKRILTKDKEVLRGYDLLRVFNKKFYVQKVYYFKKETIKKIFLISEFLF